MDQEEAIRHAKTLSIAVFHMDRAYGFAQESLHLAQKDKHEYETGASISKKEYVRRMSLRDPCETALRVTYAIPFTKNRVRSSNDTLPKLPGVYLKWLSKQERGMHDLIVEERQSLYAHSDAEYYNPEIEIGEMTKSQYLYTPDYFSIGQLEQIVALTKKMHSYLASAQHDLMSQIEPGSY